MIYPVAGRRSTREGELDLFVVAGEPVLRRRRDQREISLDTLPVDDAQRVALREWSAVANALADTDAPAAALVTKRGQQLAARLAAALGCTIVYHDPVGGQPRTYQYGGRGLIEPTPWSTGLPVALFAVAIVVFAMTVLWQALGQVSNWLALGANLVVTIGLAPTIALIHGLPVWRWLAWGGALGLVLGWLCWVVSLL